jgi:outer membrane lipoprotein-sorting protein
MIWATLAAFSGGCGPIKTVQPVAPGNVLVAKVATEAELIDSYNRTARGVQSLNATVELKPTAGSQYSGVIEEYHEVKAFLLAARPAEIRMIGQAPVVGKTVFDMTSDGETFRVYIPSKHKFLVGPVAVERRSKKPIENLRPQHVLEALLWPEIAAEQSMLFEEFNDERGRYYVITLLSAEMRPEIARKIWFSRADLNVARMQSFGAGGTLVSDVHIADWQPLAADQERSVAEAPTVASFPRTIRIERPHDDYRLDLQITKLMLNGSIPPEQFRLEQPPGTELVRVGEGAEENKP